METKKKALPTVGMRIVKSALGVLLVFIIYLLQGRKRTPFYSALSVLWCMQPGTSEIKSKSFQRTIGTFIGAIFGLMMILIELYVLKAQSEWIRYGMISLLIIPIIYTTLLINKKDASYFSCVVFLSITVNHLSDANPFIFVVNRVMDTLIGIGIAYFINTVHLPTKKQNHILFVSELDEVLLGDERTMSPYSKYELNRMLDQGAQFTLATMRPPAALIPVLKDIHIKLPIIAMDGAILYDFKENRILKKYAMHFKEVKTLVAYFKERQYHCFVNVIIEDTVVIYYDTFNHSVEKDIYEKLRSSPYRNYMKGPILEKGDPIYLMLIDQTDKMKQLYNELEKDGYTKHYKVLRYGSKQYPGYDYIKIYHKEALKKNMIATLKQRVGVSQVITLGDSEDIGDGVIRGEDANEIVKNFKKAYRLYWWQQ